MCTVTVKRITDVDLMNRACSFTTGKPAHVNIRKMFRSEHSPIRTQLYWIEMKGIPSFVSVHFVRHSATGQLHFVKSNRDDRGGDETVDRNTPVDHAMLLNAQHLIDMAKRRLCFCSHKETIKVMLEIKKQVDNELAECMKAPCAWEGICREYKQCKELKEFIPHADDQ